MSEARTELPGEILLERAILAATRAHAGQRDKGGLPYILHPIAVMLSLPSDDWDGRIVAVLHDVVEDTDVRLIDLQDHDFPDRIIVAVDAITKSKGDTYRTYWARCKADPIAARVKVADMRHNASIERLRVLPYGDQQYLSQKYAEGLAFFGVSPDVVDAADPLAVKRYRSAYQTLVQRQVAAETRLEALVKNPGVKNPGPDVSGLLERIQVALAESRKSPVEVHST